MGTTLAERFRLAREKNKLSQAKAARMVGVTQSLVYKLEKGLLKGTTHVNAFAMVYGVHPEWILADKGSIDDPYPIGEYLREPARLPLLTIDQVNAYLRGEIKNTTTEICLMPLPSNIAAHCILMPNPDSAMYSPAQHARSIPTAANLIIDLSNQFKPNIDDVLLISIKRSNKNKIRVLIKDGDDERLAPLNPAFESYQLSECDILGRVVGATQSFLK